MLRSILAPDCVTPGRTLIFAGKPGKTHLTKAIAGLAIQNGFDTAEPLALAQLPLTAES